MNSNPMLILGIVVVVALFAVLFMWPVETNDNPAGLNSAGDEGPAGDAMMNSIATVEKKTFELSIITDKEVYDEGDHINITLLVDSPIAVEGAEFNINAVKDRRGFWEIRESEDMDLTEGMNSLEFNERLPSCSSCSGVSEGNHTIEAVLTFKNETQIANRTAIIELIG